MGSFGRIKNYGDSIPYSLVRFGKEIGSLDKIGYSGKMSLAYSDLSSSIKAISRTAHLLVHRFPFNQRIRNINLISRNNLNVLPFNGRNH